MWRPGHDDREIWRIALPTFAALISEPLMLLADTIVIGYVSTPALAGLAVASTVIGTVVGLCIFLAYGSTATVSRRHGAGDRPGAVSVGFSAVWLAVGLGIAVGALTAATSRVVTQALASSGQVADQAHTYLSISAAGLPAMLVLLAATGALRGVLDVRTPLVVMIAANLVNIVLNLVLVVGAGQGIAGAAIATVIAQWGAAIVLSIVLLRMARRERADIRPRFRGIARSALDGIPLLLRTATLRGVLLIATFVAATQGDAPLAAHQVATTVVTLFAFALDAVAIAGQTLTGNALGAGDVGRTRRLTRRMMGWGLVGGGLIAVGLLAVSGVAPIAFTPDPIVRQELVPVLIVIAIIQPLSGLVFVLDGVLIGAGDAVYLAKAGLAVFAAYIPAALLVWQTGGGLTWLWVTYGLFIAARLITLVARERSDAWLHVGATR